jgi:predicted AlkP superfamily pyrophosphatase or phosphodiesterase
LKTLKVKFLPWLVILVLTVTTVMGCNKNEKPKILGSDLPYPISNNADRSHKKVILLIVDSLMHDALESRIKKGTLPALEFLKNQGTYIPRLISPFPTMSVVIESTILTGTYSHQHKIPGLVWVNLDEGRTVNYGSGNRAILDTGISRFTEDALYHLNQTHLNRQVRTLHEELNERGFTTGSINTLIYRGSYRHKLQIPDFISNTLNLQGTYNVLAPRFFAFGLLANPVSQSLNLPDNPWFQNMGVNDDYSLKMLKHLIKTKQLPDFTIAYLPNMDKEVHKYGSNYHKELERVDRRLQEVVQQFGSWDKALEECIFIILGDHGQSDIGPAPVENFIDLRALYNGFQIASADQIQSGDDVAFAINERMAFIYPLDLKHRSINDWVKPLLHDSRIDVIAWKGDNGYIEVAQGGTEKGLRFRQGTWKDEFNQSWEWRGDADVLDLKKDKNGKIGYGEFPDGLQRVWSALHAQSEPMIVVNAKPKYQFIGKAVPTHLRGGAHGGLSAKDTYAAMIIAGTDQKPRYDRMVDLKEFILRLFQ